MMDPSKITAPCLRMHLIVKHTCDNAVVKLTRDQTIERGLKTRVGT